MNLTHHVTIPADRERAWAFLMDIPTAASSVPGVRDVESIDDDRYRGLIDVRVGPIKLSLEGEISVVERDDAAGRAVLRADGTDRRLGGGVRAIVTMTVTDATEATTDIDIASDVQVLGRIGEIGQPLMRRKADEIIRAFAADVARRLG